MNNIDILEEYLKNNTIDIGIICVPRINAQKVADLLVKGGVKAIWNFAPVNLLAPEGITVKNENLTASLMTLRMHMKENY